MCSNSAYASSSSIDASSLASRSGGATRSRTDSTSARGRRSRADVYRCVARMRTCSDSFEQRGHAVGSRVVGAVSDLDDRHIAVSADACDGRLLRQPGGGLFGTSSPLGRSSPIRLLSAGTPRCGRSLRARRGGHQLSAPQDRRRPDCGNCLHVLDVVHPELVDQPGMSTTSELHRLLQQAGTDLTFSSVPPHRVAHPGRACAIRFWSSRCEVPVVPTRGAISC